MSQVCQVTGRRPQCGNRVSHANNRTKHRFMPNIKKRRFWVPSLKAFVRLKVSARGIRIIDKLGIEAVLEKIKK